MARPKGSKTKIMTDALVLALSREAQASDGTPTKRLNLIAEKLVKQAESGDIQAIKEVFDRVEGKAQQAIEHSGAVESATTHYVADRSRTLTELLDASEGAAEPGDSSGESERLH